MQNVNRLIEACKKNDSKAQMHLYDKYINAMYNIALKYVTKDVIAQDIVQDAFIKAFHKIDSFNHKVTFGAWLKRIVINQAIDYLKKKKLNLVSIDDNTIHLIDDDTNWETETEITMDDILSKMDELPIKYKTILQLYLLEGYDHNEISEILNISNATSRSQLSRGKNKLKELLKTKNYAKRY